MRPAQAPWQLPIQWPDSQREAAPRERDLVQTERLLKAGIVFAVLAVTLLDRFGLRVSERFAVAPALLAMYALLGAMLLSGALGVNVRGALAYAAVAAVAAASYLVNASLRVGAPSPTSLLLLLVLYAPLAFSLLPGKVRPGLWRWTVEAYVAAALLVALAGIAQFFAQFAVRPPWLFDYRAYVPEALLASGGWNTVSYAGDWVKSNGFFLREPSIFSIVVAFAIVCELDTLRRKWAMAVLALALLLTYSGSGLACLAFAMLFPLGGRWLRRALGFAAAAAAVYFVLGEALNLSFTVDRVGEFGAGRTSAYCRFVFPAELIAQHADATPWATVLGHGPGTMPVSDHTCTDGVETTYAKALFEYGLAGFAAFGALLVGALNRSGAPARIRAALAVMWLLLGGNLLRPEFLMLVFLFSAMWPRGAAAEDARR